MPYFISIIIILFFFIDIGIQIEHNNETKIYLLVAFFKIKLPIKSFNTIMKEASKHSSKENIESFKSKIKLIKPIRAVLAGTTLDYIEIIRYDDFESLSLVMPLITYNCYNLLNSFLTEMFLIIKNSNYLYYPFNQKKLILNLKARINLFKLLKILVQEIFVIIGGKIYEQGRRIFKS